MSAILGMAEIFLSLFMFLLYLLHHDNLIACMQCALRLDGCDKCADEDFLPDLFNAFALLHHLLSSDASFATRKTWDRF